MIIEWLFENKRKLKDSVLEYFQMNPQHKKKNARKGPFKDLNMFINDPEELLDVHHFRPHCDASEEESSNFENRKQSARQDLQSAARRNKFKELKQRRNRTVKKKFLQNQEKNGYQQVSFFLF